MRRANIGNRDANEAPIFNALLAAGCSPVRGKDSDIYCRSRVDMRGMLVEVKTQVERDKLTPIQVKLRELFGDRYAVVCSVDEALAAVGVRA